MDPRAQERKTRPVRVRFSVLVALLIAWSWVVPPTASSTTRLEMAARRGHARVYFIAADQVEWDYAPSGKNLITGQAFGAAESTWMGSAPNRIGRRYLKSIFHEYTDGTFTREKPRPKRWEHLGILGPVVQAEGGDTISVTLKNNTRFPVSLHAHGVWYDKEGEGAPYDDGVAAADKGGSEVLPGEKFTYLWRALDRSGPGPNDGSSVMWMYHSHVDEVADTNAGLMGPIIITRRGMARADGSPKDVDRQFVTVFSVFDENVSRWTDINRLRATTSPVAPDDPGFVESNLKHAINGFVFGNVAGLAMRRGDRVRWYVMGMGSERDVHTPHWHGNTVLSMGMRTDVVSVFPATMVIADMRPDNKGTWLFHCHVNDHLTAGMAALYQVR
jgi:FtsP/CotA-like multicopper oxidase with cupredoxin domain